MKINLHINGSSYSTDLSLPLDISISAGRVKCFRAPDFAVKPVEAGRFIGSVKQGAPVNFFNMHINPHGNGTHTECLGHITETHEPIHQLLKSYHFPAQLVSVPLKTLENGDQVISSEALQSACPDTLHEALILRTLPNSDDKTHKDYSDTNPPYLQEDAMRFIVEKGVQHLLLDLPSVDREEDGGKLICHRLFWNMPGNTASVGARMQCTITELIFVPDVIKDGLYLLNLQIPTLPLDAVPSRPVLYLLTEDA